MHMIPVHLIVVEISAKSKVRIKQAPVGTFMAWQVIMQYTVLIIIQLPVKL